MLLLSPLCPECVPQPWRTPTPPSTSGSDAAIPGEPSLAPPGRVSHSLLRAPSLPGHASILAIICTVICLWLCRLEGPAVLQGWGRGSYSPSSPSTRDKPAQCSVIQMGCLRPQLSKESCCCLCILPCCSSPSPRGSDHPFHRLNGQAGMVLGSSKR